MMMTTTTMMMMMMIPVIDRLAGTNTSESRLRNIVTIINSVANGNLIRFSVR